MVTGVNSHASVVTHSTAPGTSMPSLLAERGETVSRREIEATPTYFRSISSISYGSLAGAYSSLMATDTQTPTSTLQRTGIPAILSGSGIPAALQAYEEADHAFDV